MFLLSKYVFCLSMLFSVSCAVATEKIKKGTSSSEDFLSKDLNEKEWKKIRFVQGGVTMKVPKDFEAVWDPEETSLLNLNYDPPANAHIRSAFLSVEACPVGPQDLLNCKERSLDEFLQGRQGGILNYKKLNAKGKRHVFNNKVWIEYNIIQENDPKRPGKIIKKLFHKIASSSAVKDRANITFGIFEQAYSDKCAEGSEQPCGPLTEEFYTWPIFKKILESIEYIEK